LHLGHFVQSPSGMTRFRGPPVKGRGRFSITCSEAPDKGVTVGSLASTPGILWVVNLVSCFSGDLLILLRFLKFFYQKLLNFLVISRPHSGSHHSQPAGQRPDMHRLGTCTHADARALIDSRAGRKHIIDQENPAV
jgi:hypothetical protein